MTEIQLTAKQESFCLAYIETGNASEAYRTAYSAKGMKAETVHRKAYELMGNGKITARISELQSHHRQRHDVTVDELLLELEEGRELAKAKGNPSAMIAATMGKAKLLGFDRQTIDLNQNAPLPTAINVFFSDEPDPKAH